MTFLRNRKWFSRWELEIIGGRGSSGKGRDYPNERPRFFCLHRNFAERRRIYRHSARRSYDLSIYFSLESRRSTVSR